ncbi:MAG: hypothetical protein QXY90_06285 [Candidatus Anstonellales archaeon]
MQIKRFEGKDIKEVLQRVREEFGPEAIILSTKKLRPKSGFFAPLCHSLVEVVAAIDREQKSLQNPSLSSSFLSLNQIKDREGEEDFLLKRILSVGLHPEFINGFLDDLKLSQKNLSGSHLLEVYQGFLQWKLMASIEVLTPRFDRKRIWSFIGPTGVGKTTTMVKLAAQWSLSVTPKIILITIDTYRIGAIEQLSTYANILKLPIEVAHHPEELKKIIKKWEDWNIFLIDTPGRSPNQMDQIEELKNFLTVYPNIENHLVLSATTKDQDLERIVHQFSLLPIESYIFTKIDETNYFVPIFNHLFLHKKPVTYLTNGQRVPEDIEIATKGKVANLVLNSISWN